MQHPANLFDLTGRTAVVTGASSGLGVAFAKGLASAGANLVLAARRTSALEEVQSELKESGHSAISVQCDVSQEKDVERLVSSALEGFGQIDVLVNNAGVSSVVPAEEDTAEEFRRVVDINLTGAYLCMQHCGKAMLERGSGSIVNIASVLGLVGAGLIPQASYNASKAGVVNMTKGVAAQWARRGVRVNAIAPGWFPSEMTSPIFEDERTMRFMRRSTPMGRTGEPSELLGPLLLLASDASSYMTGETITVDGGWTAV